MDTRKIKLIGDIGHDLTSSALDAFSEYCLCTDPVLVLIDSPGGDEDDGFAIIDAIHHAESLGIRVTTSAIGQASSMGAMILISGTERFCSPSTSIMIHRPFYDIQDGMTTNIDDLDAMRRNMKASESRFRSILKSRTKLSVRRIAKCMRMDTYFSPDEALKYGIVDGIRTIL